MTERQVAGVGALSAPPIATSNEAAVELLRAWTAKDGPVQITLRTNWDDPAAWGLLLVDIARHAARTYAREGMNPKEALERIVRLWSAELANPTDIPEDITRTQ